MRFRIGNPNFPAYNFYLLAVTPDVETAVNRLGPVKMVSGSYDWPSVFGGYRNWTDSINSLWWPQGAEQFSTCVLLMDDARNDLLSGCVSSQKYASPENNGIFPWLVMTALLSPPEEQRPGDAFPPTDVGPVTVETPLVSWKLYPLSPVNLTSLTADERFRGLWLLPLVDIRYFERTTTLNNMDGYSSSSGTGGGYPTVCSGEDDYPAWMPPLRGYPQDLTAPLYYTPIEGIGVQPTITPPTAWGDAVDLQASMNSLRVVCRDVSSQYNVPSSDLPHSSFTGVMVDYPEDYAVVSPQPPAAFGDSYHLDALSIFQSTGMRIAGGLNNVDTLGSFTASKLQFMFEVNASTCFYSITLRCTKDYPTSVVDFEIDSNGSGTAEQPQVPAVLLGNKIQSRTPTDDEYADLVAAAKQWFLIYRWWRFDQCYMRYPGIVPVIPNGHAHMIRWDFQSTKFETTYVALEGIEGVTPESRKYAAKRAPFYAQNNGEGAAADGLAGFYAWTELTDADGTLAVGDHPRTGTVMGVNGNFATINPARDLSNKVAVPVGLTLWLVPGKAYLDVATGEIFDHLLFNTTDLMQVARLKIPVETNSLGHFRILIDRYDPPTNSMVFIKEAWALELP